MSHPSDPEGEADHSSDSDDGGGGSISRDGEKEPGEGWKDEKESLPAAEQEQSSLSPRTNGAQEINQNSGAEGGNGQSESEEEERSWASSISSDSCKSDVVIENVSGVEECNSSHTERPSGTVPVDSKEVDDEDGYYQSQNESEEEGEESPSAQRHSSTKGRNMSSPRRVIRSRRHQSQSSTSTESDDTDSEGSSYGSSVEPTNLAKPKSRVSSAASQSPPPIDPEDSDDTVTDVTPLSSPDGSPHPTLDLNDREDEGVNVEEQQLESVPASGLSKTPQDTYQDVNDHSSSSDSQLEGRLAPYCPAERNRKNYSFNNVEVRRIDRENERLLRAMSRLYSMSSAGRALAQKSRTSNNSLCGHLPHSAINRQREQQRIVRENLTLLKRLMTVKPTKGLKCSEQMADYHQQRYWGTPTQPVDTPSTQSERTSSMKPSADTEPRLDSPAHHSATSAATTETPSMKEPGARPKERGGRPKELGARPKEPGARPKEPGAARPALD